MKGEDLPADDHIVRYIKPSMILKDGSVDALDFRLRQSRPDETGLSVNWLEAFSGSKAHKLSEVRRLFRLDVRPNGRFAELNVGKILSIVSEELDTLRIVHDPLDAEYGFEADPSHAEIIGLPPAESDQAALVSDLIAEECIIDLHPAIEGHGDQEPRGR